MTSVNEKSTWVLDPSHSELLFRVKHLMITNVKGEFRKFRAEALFEGNDLSNASVSAVVDAASVFTNNDDRDTHLRSADFFDTDKYRELLFKSSSFVKNGEDEYVLKGFLTIKNITHEVTLDVEFGGIVRDPWGNEKAGFSLSGKINRKDWDLTWNAVLETGGVMVSDEVRINAEIQLVRQA